MSMSSNTNLLDELLIGSSTLIYGAYGDEVLQRIYHKLMSMNNCECLYYSIKECEPAQLAKQLDNLKHEMMSRFTAMEQEQVNNFAKLKNPPKLTVIHIENLTAYLTSTEYKAVMTIKQTLSSLCRLGRAAGMRVFMSINSLEGFSEFTLTLENIPTRIVTGRYDVNIAKQLLNCDNVWYLNQHQLVITTLDAIRPHVIEMYQLFDQDDQAICHLREGCIMVHDRQLNQHTSPEELLTDAAFRASLSPTHDIDLFSADKVVVAGQTFIVRLVFWDRRLRSIKLTPIDLAIPDPGYPDATYQMEKKRVCDAWLHAQLGEPTIVNDRVMLYQYTWGTIASCILLEGRNAYTGGWIEIHYDKGEE